MSIGDESLTLIEAYGEACREFGWYCNESTMSQGQINMAYMQARNAKQNLVDYLNTYGKDSDG